MLFKMAFRNIRAHLRRSLLTIMMMVFGYVMMSFSISLIDGSYDDVIEAFTGQKTGHVQIHNKKYADKEGFFDTIKDFSKIEQKLSSSSDVLAYSSRIKSGGLGFANGKTMGVSVTGLDFEKETKLTSLSKRLEKGEIPKKGSYGILVGKKLSQIFRLKLGDELVIISSGADGSIANDIFKVSGIMGGEGSELDDFNVYMGLENAQEFFTFYNQVHEIAMILTNIDRAKRFSKHFSLPEELIARPWQEVEKEFFRAMEMDKKGNNVGLSIIILVVALGVLNTLLMAILERTKEYGVMKAVGTNPFFLGRMIVTEAMVLSLISISIGFILSIVVNYYFSINGIILEEPISYGGMVMTGMFSKLTLNCFLVPGIVLLITTLLVSLYPAIKVVNISPVKALRDF